MPVRYLFLLSLFFISSAVQCATALSSLTDAQLCTEIGIAAAQQKASMLSRLEEEGARRDKIHITSIKPSECNKLAVAAVNQKKQHGLAKEDEKLKESYKNLESLRNQAQANTETNRQER